jgi:hypothetical protein
MPDPKRPKLKALQGDRHENHIQWVLVDLCLDFIRRCYKIQIVHSLKCLWPRVIRNSCPLNSYFPYENSIGNESMHSNWYFCAL